MPSEIAEVRFKHFQTKRIANIIRVYDYMSLSGMLRGKQKLSPMGTTYNRQGHRQTTLRMQHEVRSNFQSVINDNLPYLNSKETPRSKNDLFPAYQTRTTKLPKHETSTIGKSTNLTTNDSIFQHSQVKDSSSSQYPGYFFKHEDNLFNPMKQTGIKNQITVFHIASPDERISKHLFSQQRQKRRPSVSVKNRFQSIDIKSPRSLNLERGGTLGSQASLLSDSSNFQI